MERRRTVLRLQSLFSPAICWVGLRFPASGLLRCFVRQLRLYNFGPPMPTRCRNQLWCAAVIGWGVAATAVWCWATSYEFSTYDNSPPVAKNWPAPSPLALAASHPSLVLFLHPRCPCSRASVHELTRLVDRLPNALRPDITIVATLPQAATSEWRDSGTVRNAANLPHATVVWDKGGAIAHAFGATTSGAVFLYQPDGQLRYAGGITASRGHQGDNAGSEALHQLLTQSSIVPISAAPVFGCPLCLDGASSALASVCDETIGACSTPPARGTP